MGNHGPKGGSTTTREKITDLRSGGGVFGAQTSLGGRFSRATYYPGGGIGVQSSLIWGGKRGEIDPYKARATGGFVGCAPLSPRKKVG